MRKILLASVSAAVLGCSGVVSAQATPPTPAYHWTGFYIGVNVGGGWSSNGATFTPDTASNNFFAPGPAGLLPNSVSLAPAGVIGGLQLGYNWQFDPHWLIGVEADFNGSDMKGSAANSGTTIGTPIANSEDERIRWFGTVRARLGYLPMDNYLVYFTGGFAYAGVDRSASLTSASGINSNGTTGFMCIANVTCFAGSSSTTATGWVLGGGLEYKLWKNLSVKAEYLRIGLGAGSLTETALLPPSGSPTVLSTIGVTYGRTNLNVARLGMSWHF